MQIIRPKDRSLNGPIMSSLEIKQVHLKSLKQQEIENHLAGIRPIENRTIQYNSLYIETNTLLYNMGGVRNIEKYNNFWLRI